MQKLKIRGKRFVAAVLAASLCFSLQAFATESEVKKQQQEMQQQLNQINQQMKSIEKQRNSVLNEISTLDSELVELMMNLEMLESDLAAKEEELVQAQADYEAAKQREEEQYEAMKLRIQYIYMEGNTDYLSMLLEADSFADFLNRTDFAKEIQTKDREMLTEYQETKAEVEELLEQLEQEKADLEDLQAEYEQEKAVVEASLAEKKAEQADYDSQLAEAKKQAQAYTKKIQEKQAELKKLAAERAKAEAAANANKGSGSSSSSSGSKTPVSGNSSTGNAIAQYALQFVGNPYVAGGTSLTNGADCSGFTQSVFRNFGISLPRTSSAQRSAGREVSYAEAQAGDLICYSGHVAIYLGGGRIVHASTERTGIKTGNATYRAILSVRRCY